MVVNILDLKLLECIQLIQVCFLLDSHTTQRKKVYQAGIFNPLKTSPEYTRDGV